MGDNSRFDDIFKAAMTDLEKLAPLLSRCLAARQGHFDVDHFSALRLFNGHLEGFPHLVVDLFGKALVVSFHPGQTELDQDLAIQLWSFYHQQIHWLDCCILKDHNAKDAPARKGVLLFGAHPCDRVLENGVWYAVDLQLNQDASFYPDTRNLRTWLKEHASGWDVLNTFAYTGSLGIAALAGGARKVVQTDSSRKFLSLAIRSAELNGIQNTAQILLDEDFFTSASRFRHAKTAFDCVIIDPPFFSVTSKGKVDLVSNSAGLINKVRPLVREGGWLIAINNAVFVSGQETLHVLQEICKDGYLVIKDLLDVPFDVTGTPETIAGKSPIDSQPFNHSTKIALLQVMKRK